MNPDEIINKLRSILGSTGTVITDKHKSSDYLTDWRGQITGQTLAIVEPQKVPDIQGVVKLCLEQNIAITPQGGNTGGCGGCIPNFTKGLNIVLSLRQLNKILDYDPVGQTLTLESGCTLDKVQNLVKQDRLYFPVSLASSDQCTIGGNLATNAGGCCVIQNGMTRDNVLGIEVVLGNSELYSDLRKLRKNNDGYDIKNIFIGSEGTLGIITAAVLKLRYMPSDYISAVIGLPDLSSAIKLIHDLRRHLERNIEAAEIFSHKCWELVNDIYEQYKLDVITSNWYMIVDIGIHHDSQKFVYHDILKSALDRFVGKSYSINLTSEGRSQAWKIRNSIPLAEKKYQNKIMRNDISLPLSSWVQFYGDVQKLVEQYRHASLFVFGHIGDGSLHLNVGYVQEEEKIKEGLHRIVQQYQGSIAAEHGVGQTKVTDVEKLRSTSHNSMMRFIKKAFDPRNILNPGKVVP